jgi:hypothetical protein
MKVTSTIFVLLVSLAIASCTNSESALSTPSISATPAPTRLIELQVIPKTLRTGMRATMVGIGFDGGEVVRFYLIRPDGTKTIEGESTANKNGGAAYAIEVTEEWQPGKYMAHVISKRNPSRSAQQQLDLIRR